MYSILFPNIFSTDGALLVEDSKATLQNIKLALASDQRTLFGDPAYGSLLKRFFYEPNDQVVLDLIIDEIYSTIRAYIPQVLIKRNYINIESSGNKITAKIKCINKLDGLINLYDIDLIGDLE